jgi:hypothetical protein
MTELDAILDKINEEAAQSALDGETALELLQAVYRNKRAPLSVRMRAATIAIQYESPRLAVTGVLRDDAGFAAQLERALIRSNTGKVIELKPNGEERESPDQ